jgi:hypothetical protein
MTIVLAWTLPDESGVFTRAFDTADAALWFIDTRGVLPRGTCAGFMSDVVKPILEKTIEHAKFESRVQSGRVLSSLVVTVVP